MKPKNWEQAKGELDLMDFPEKGEYKESKKGEAHGQGKKQHSLITYEYEFQVGGFNVLAKYNYCKECAQVRNKVLTIFNEEKNVCYQKVFKWHGKDPDAKDAFETARDIFAWLFVVLAI